MPFVPSIRVSTAELDGLARKSSPSTTVRAIGNNTSKGVEKFIPTIRRKETERFVLAKPIQRTVRAERAVPSSNEHHYPPSLPGQKIMCIR